jgi:hypothetical protein
MKARAAAGIMSNEDEPRSEPEGKVQVKVQVGQKRKKMANTKVHVSVAPRKALPKKTKKTMTVDSDDSESSEPEGDEVDAYERLREQRETDRPVSDRESEMFERCAEYEPLTFVPLGKEISHLPRK